MPSRTASGSAARSSVGGRVGGEVQRAPDDQSWLRSYLGPHGLRTFGRRLPTKLLSPRFPPTTPEYRGDRLSDQPHADPELASEQAYVDAAYARLEAMRDRRRTRPGGYSDVRAGGTHQARLERDIAWNVTQRRLADLDIGDAPLMFGRLDMEDRSQLVRRADRRRGRAAHAAGRRLAGPGVGAVLPGDHDRADGRRPAPAPHLAQGSRAGRASTTKSSTRRPSTRPGCRSPVRVRSSPRSNATEPVVWATSSRRSRPSRTKPIRADLPGPLVVAGGPGTGKTAWRFRHGAPYLLYYVPAPARRPGRVARRPEPGVPALHRARAPLTGEQDVRLSTIAGLRPSVQAGPRRNPTRRCG